MSVIKNPPSWLGSDKENVDFMNYVAEQTKNATSLQPMTKLCRDFITKIGSNTSEKRFYARVRKHLLRIHELVDFDNDTKVRMMFSLSVPVDSGYLMQLKKDADVEFDNVNRITKYEKKDGGLVLIRDRVPPVRQYDTGDDNKLLNFLAVKAKMEQMPVSDSDFVTEFKDVTGSEKNILHLKNRYQLVKRQIYLSTEFDKPTCIRMMFISGATIHESVLEELRITATVEIDDHQRIIKYQANDGSIQLEGEHKRLYRRRSSAVEELKENLITRNRRTPKRLFPNEDFMDEAETDAESESSIKMDKKYKRNSIEGTTLKVPKAEAAIKFKWPPPPRDESIDHQSQLKRTQPKSELIRLQKAFNNFTVKKEMSFDRTTTTSSTLQYADAEQISAKKLLEWLRLFICSLESEELIELQTKVDLAIIKCGNETVSITDIVQTLRTGVQIMKKSSVSSDEPSSINCSDCLLNLYTTLLTLPYPAISDFRHEIKYIRNKMENRFGLVSTGSIRPSLETVLLLASS
uniref:SPK domain-containing protein n=2 Tax=Caenorhabditis tropicalis TaxID=1561998 RepID=A0A1I7UMT1_9PELO